MSRVTYWRLRCIPGHSVVCFFPAAVSPFPLPFLPHVSWPRQRPSFASFLQSYPAMSKSACSSLSPYSSRASQFVVGVHSSMHSAARPTDLSCAVRDLSRILHASPPRPRE